jgi:hypothetical protein
VVSWAAAYNIQQGNRQLCQAMRIEGNSKVQRRAARAGLVAGGPCGHQGVGSERQATNREREARKQAINAMARAGKSTAVQQCCCAPVQSCTGSSSNARQKLLLPLDALLAATRRTAGCH